MDILEKEIHLIKILRDDVLFLTRAQIQHVLGKDVRRTNERLFKLYGEKILDRKYRLDTFDNFQSPVYFLGEKGAELTGMGKKDYTKYRERVINIKDRAVAHLVLLYSIYVRFYEESEIMLWTSYTDEESFILIDFKPDAFIRYKKFGEVYECFIEADRNTESLPVIQRKLEKYHRFYQSSDFGTHFTGSGFRVLFASSHKRNIAPPSKHFVICSIDELNEKFPDKLFEPQVKEYHKKKFNVPEPPVKKVAPPVNIPTITDDEFQRRFIKWSCATIGGVWGAASWKSLLDYIASIHWGPSLQIFLLLGITALILVYAKRM